MSFVRHEVLLTFGRRGMSRSDFSKGLRTDFLLLRMRFLGVSESAYVFRENPWCNWSLVSPNRVIGWASFVILMAYKFNIWGVDDVSQTTERSVRENQLRGRRYRGDPDN
jgi:hypothetical protein